MGKHLFYLPKRYRMVLALAGPILIANLSTPLLGAVDTAVMGHLDASVYLAGVALGAMIFSFLYWGFGFLRMGTTALCSQARGQKAYTEMRLVFWRGVFVAVAIGLVLLGLHQIIGGIAFWLLDVENSLEKQAQHYFNIRIWSAPATLINYVLLGWFLGNGDARLPLYLQVFINLLNIFLDLLFVIVLAMGVEGVALATVIAEYSGTMAGLWLLLRQPVFQQGWSLQDKNIFLATAIKRLILINRDIFIRTMSLLLAFAYFTKSGANLGTDIVAANAILLKFMEFAAYGLDGFAFAGETLIAAAYGRKNRGLMKKLTRICLIFGGISAVAMVVFFALMARFLIPLMTSLPALQNIATTFSPWVIFMPIFAVWGFIYDGVFLGTTATRALRNSMILCLLIMVFCGYWLVPLCGNHGLWASMMIFMLARGVVLGLYFPAILPRN